MGEEVKTKKKDLGIFYTDQRIVNFIYDILLVWKEAENKKSKRWNKKNPSVIDPAVGEGVFLKTAIEKRFTRPEWVFGLDLDKEVVEKWKKINLLHSFGGNKEDLEAHFFCQNGLDKIHWEQHKKKYSYKLKGEDIKNQQFDAVVGNPPYGGVGLGGIEMSDVLVDQLTKFQILPEEIASKLVFANRQTDIFNFKKSVKAGPQIKQRLASFPIEVLFIDRFVQLAKPGGFIAVVIPDGILANSNLQYARAFIARKAKVAAIVSLPRDAFKHVGTAAKTSILFLQKYSDEEQKNVSLDYPVFLSAVEEISEENLKIISDLYQKFYNQGTI